MKLRQEQHNGIKKIILFRFLYFSALLLSVSACSLLPCETGRKVDEVVIESSGQSLNPKEAEFCAEFKPTQAQVKRFFSRAVPITSNRTQHDWYTPCYAKGSVTFSGGGSGDWLLYSSGIAVLNWAYEKNELYLYNARNNGWHDPFECSYGPADDTKESCIMPGF